MKDGIRVANVMRGKHRGGNVDDTKVLKLFDKGWLIELKQIQKVLGLAETGTYENQGKFRLTSNKMQSFGNLKLELD